MFSAGPTLVPRRPCGPHRLHRDPVRERGVVPDLVDLGLRQRHARRIDGDAVAEIDEAAALVQREHVLDLIGQVLGDIGRIVAEDLAGLGRAPAAERSWSDCGRSQ